MKRRAPSAPSPRVPAPLGTGRAVFVRHPCEADRAGFIALRRTSRAFLQSWEPRPVRGFDAWGNDAFDRELALADTEQAQRLLICRRSDGAIVGRIGLGGIIRGPFQSCFIGYWIGAPFAGQGFMTEGLGLALRHMFVTMRLHRGEANIQPHNGASRRVAIKCGFRLEGYSPRYLKIAGRWADHERWAITAEDWRGLRHLRPPARP